MGFLDLPSYYLTAFVAKLCCWTRVKSIDRNSDEKKVVQHNSSWSIRNPLLDMPVGKPFDMIISQQGDRKGFQARALRDDKIEYPIVSHGFAAKHKISVRKTISGLPSVSTDSRGREYKLEGYFEGWWRLSNISPYRYSYVAIAENLLPDDVDVLLRVSEEELGSTRASAEFQQANPVLAPIVTNEEKKVNDEQAKAKSDLEIENDNATHQKKKDALRNKFVQRK